MAVLKCNNCGAALDPNPAFCHHEEADGTKWARCPDCDRQYEVPKGRAKPEPDPPPASLEPPVE